MSHSGNIEAMQKGVKGKESKFRGVWSPVVADPPKFSSWIPIPEPAVKAPPPPKPAAAPVTPANPYSQEIPKPDALLHITDRYRNWRSFIKEDGEVRDKYGNLLGYINIDSVKDEVGSANEEFLGYLKDDNIFNNNDEMMGSLNPGTVCIRNCQGKTLAQISRGGEIEGNTGSYLGKVEGYTHHQMKVVALYLFIIDPGMFNEIEG